MVWKAALIALKTAERKEVKKNAKNEKRMQ